MTNKGYYKAHKEQCHKYDQQYYQQHKEERAAYQRQYDKEHKPEKAAYYRKHKEHWHEWDEKHREHNNQRMEKLNQRRKLEVLSHYSGGQPKCAYCGIADIDVLCLDHINNDGSQHRKVMGSNRYRWIISNDFPKNFQVLCYNCNMKKHINFKNSFRRCPHCGKKGMYKKDHTMLCCYCDLYVILAPTQDW